MLVWRRTDPSQAGSVVLFWLLSFFQEGFQICNGSMHAGNTGVSKNYVATWDSVRIGNDQLKVAVVGLHFKAFPTDKKSCSQREGQAGIARDTIQDLYASGMCTFICHHSRRY